MSSTKCLIAGCVLLMLALTGCSSDDVEEILGIDPEGETAEAAVEAALNNVIDPLALAIDLISGFVLPSPLAASTAGGGGISCPSTDGWCGSGSASCAVNGSTLEFTFASCTLTDGEDTVTVNSGRVDVAPPTTAMTLVDLVVNGGLALNGTVTFSGACDTVWNINASDGTVTSGTLVQCDSDENPQASSILVITATVPNVGDVQMTFTFNGTGTAAVSVTVDAAPYATCSVILDTFDASCDGV